MTSPQTLPTSGYALERVYAQRQLCETIEPGPDTATSEDVTLGWDWRITAENRFEVLVRVEYAPTRDRPEQVEVAVVGAFRPVGEAQSVELHAFVRVHAPSILMPYAREIVSSMTGRGFFGPTPVYLPPINVAKLMERIDPEATTGAEQLRKNPGLLELAASRRRIEHGQAPVTSD